MTEKDPSKIDQLLDLLLDALQERQAARGTKRPGIHTPQAQESQVREVAEPIQPDIPEDDHDELADVDQVAVPEMDVPEEEEDVVVVPDVPKRLPTIYLDRMLGRLMIVLVVLTVLINIPYNRYGTNLARSMPDRQALVIRDGLVLKGEGDEIYVLEDNHKRWISSLDAFDYYGFHWEEVNLVDDAFLDQFPSGPPLSILYKCDGSPHVYAIENGVKRWIKDIPTFEAQGYVWDDVQIVSCTALENIPSGPPIPPDAGEPPPP
jgi:hypothetical protein